MALILQYYFIEWESCSNLLSRIFYDRISFPLVTACLYWICYVLCATSLDRHMSLQRSFVEPVSTSPPVFVTRPPVWLTVEGGWLTANSLSCVIHYATLRSLSWIPLVPKEEEKVEFTHQPVDFLPLLLVHGRGSKSGLNGPGFPGAHCESLTDLGPH